VEAVNATDADSVAVLNGWLSIGMTVSVLGSSGVGKSTLINTLLGYKLQSTKGIREDDDKGRHTTTRRSLLHLPQGGLILDTPGMRELQLADAREGIAITFGDIEQLSESCRFNDCAHQSEPGCAVLAAIESGKLDSRRLQNYRKLLREEALNSSSLAERRATDKALGEFYKRTLKESNSLKGR
jgi:ribosome biogenesis GTPase